MITYQINYRDVHCGECIALLHARAAAARSPGQAGGRPCGAAACGAAGSGNGRQREPRGAAGATFVDVGGVARHNNGVVALPARPARGERVAIMSAQVRGGRAR